VINDVETKDLSATNGPTESIISPESQPIPVTQPPTTKPTTTSRPVSTKKQKNSRNVGGRKSVKRPKGAPKRNPENATIADGNVAKYPRHSVEKALRIPRAIIDQNAGRECSDREAATFANVGFGGPFRVELSSAIKYGFLDRPKPGHVRATDRARQAIRPQHPGDEIEALRQAIMNAPDVSDVYKHYRGENLPDGTFFSNALTDKFGIPGSKITEFNDIFIASLKSAHLIEQRGDKQRILDVTADGDLLKEVQDSRKIASSATRVDASDNVLLLCHLPPLLEDTFSISTNQQLRRLGFGLFELTLTFSVLGKSWTKSGPVLIRPRY
jgi:hypothetical protein